MSTISATKVEALAKRSHAKCHGRGVLGYRPGTGASVLCACVFRNLHRQGVNTAIQSQVEKALAQDPPAAG